MKLIDDSPTEIFGENHAASSTDDDESGRNKAKWWYQPGGPDEVLRVALPLVVSCMSYSVMHFCDRMFLAWHSTTALGAAVTAGALMWTLFSLPMGIASYSTTFVAQFHGANQHSRIGLITWQAIRIGLYCSPLYLVVALFAPSLFALFGHPQGLVLQESLYFQSLSLGAGGVIIASALNAYYVGRGKTKIIMVTNVFAALLNILLDAWLIFGGLGIEPLGIVGAGFATSIAMWFKVIVYAWYMYLHPEHKIHDLRSGRRWDAALTRRLLKFGTPNGVQFLLEGGAITLFVLLIGRISERAAAATAVAFSVNMVAFIPVLGIAMAATTVVGQKIGAGQPQIAARATWTSLGLALFYCSFFVVAYVAVPQMFLMAHNSVGSEFAEVSDLAILLLRFVAAYCLFDAVQLVFVSAIKGAGDTWFVLKVTFALGALFLVAGHLITRNYSEDPDSALLGWWFALTGWIILLAIVYGWRFLQGKWKSMTVIEQKFE